MATLFCATLIGPYRDTDASPSYANSKVNQNQTSFNPSPSSQARSGLSQAGPSQASPSQASPGKANRI